MSSSSPCSRPCSRTACQRRAVATLTYVYADQTAVLGPLATFAEPHAYDLCELHAERLSAPRGWEVVRLALGTVEAGPNEDDLLALAEAVREAARPLREPAGSPGRRAQDDRDFGAAPGMSDLPAERGPGGPGEGVRRGHLRSLSTD